jgi:predicted hotdog family 3-hydroxylacyl-ACP dehydratase
MAQTIGAYVGLISLQRGEPIEIGYLLGTRRSEFFCEAYSPGQCLRIRAQLMGHFDNMGIFDCSIYDGKDQSLLMKGTLKVFRPQAKSPWGFFQERQERDG